MSLLGVLVSNAASSSTSSTFTENHYQTREMRTKIIHWREQGLGCIGVGGRALEPPRSKAS